MEQWKNNILSSLAGMEKAQPDPDLFLKIKNKIETQEQKTIREPKVAWLSVAAVILMIICSNVIVIQNYYENQETPQAEANFDVSISRDYNIYRL